MLYIYIYIYIHILFLHTMYVVFLGARPTCLKQVLDKSMELRTAVTMRRDFVQLLPEGTKFFHPLCLGASGSLSWALNQPAHPGRDLRPRDARYPVLPFWLDGTELNGWDQQSQPLCRTWDFCERCGSLLLCFLVSSVPSCFLLALRNGYFTRHLSK